MVPFKPVIVANIAIFRKSTANFSITLSILLQDNMVVARQHRGLDQASNLVWACHRCNLQKVSNLTGIDPVTGEVAPLFNLRRDRWEDTLPFAARTLMD
jgi:5-methylcytosine-specific restriction endonuclease McrA